jgi:uncharacterized membrane protein YgcG
VDAEGLRSDACLAKVIAAARHFIEHVAGALAEQPPQRWRHNTMAAEQMASEEGGGGAGSIRGGGIRGEGGDVGGRGSRGACRSGKLARSHL